MSAEVLASVYSKLSGSQVIIEHCETQLNATSCQPVSRRLFSERETNNDCVEFCGMPSSERYRAWRIDEQRWTSVARERIEQLHDCCFEVLTLRPRKVETSCTRLVPCFALAQKSDCFGETRLDTARLPCLEIARVFFSYKPHDRKSKTMVEASRQAGRYGSRRRLQSDYANQR